MNNCDKVFDEIIINNEIEVDCFQNLLLDYLRCFNVRTDELKFIWPFRFVKKYNPQNKNWKIENEDAISLDRIRDMYNIQYKKEYFVREGNRLEVVRKYVDVGHPVFVCVDEYYIPYHYEHIFSKQHGVHTLLVTGIDLQNNIARVVSAIPYFKGNIPLKNLYNSLESKEVKQWFCILDMRYYANPDDIAIKKNHDAFFEKANNTEIIYSKNIAEYLLTTNDNEIFKRIEELCIGNWGWKITKKGELLIDYLKKVSNGCKECIDVADLIGEMNREWTIAFRLLFKSIYSKNINDINKAIDYLKNESQKEEVLRKKISKII